MGFNEHPQIITPPDDTILWRYFSFFGFIELIETSRLRFNRADRFKDPLEGTHTDAEDSFLTIKYSDKMMEEVPPTEFFIRLAPITNFVSCWREGNRESMAMWDLYNKGDGTVAVKTTVGHLKKVLEAEESAFLGQVRYIPWETHKESDIDSLAVCFRKDISYQHEAEVRAVVNRSDWLGHSIGQMQKGEKMPDIVERIPAGIDLMIDLHAFVTGIVVGPEEKSRSFSLVQKIVERYQFPWTVVPSDRLRRR